MFDFSGPGQNEKRKAGKVGVTLVAAFCFLGAAAPTAAVSPSVLASPNPQDSEVFLDLPAHDLEIAQKPTTGSSARVGDRLALRIVGLSLADKKEIKLSDPAGEESLLDQGWALIREPGVQNHPSGDPVFLATPLKAGKLTLPSLAVEGQNAELIARTNPFELEVISAIQPDDPKPQEPVPVRPPARLAFPWWVIALFALLGIAAIVVVILLLRRWSQKRSRALPPLPAAPPKPEDQVALESLAELEKQELMLKGRFKGHYFGVSEILKRYLGERFGFDALECTSAEMLIVLKERLLLNEDVLARCAVLFEKMDCVKFTDHVPPQEQGGEILREARWLIERTRKPAPAVALGAVAGPGK